MATPPPNTNSAACLPVSKPTILISFPLLPPNTSFLTPLHQRFSLLCPDQFPVPSSFIAQHSSSIHALVTYFAPSHLILSLPNLRLIACPGIGVDEIDLQCCRERGIAVTNGGFVSSGDVADLAILLMLAASRRLSTTTDRRTCSRDGASLLASKVSGKRVGIVGLGQIGLAIARRAEAFGCIISYKGRSMKPNLPYVYYSDLMDLAADSNIIFVSCALTNETRHLIGRKVLHALGPDGILVNIARGPIVDEVELVATLKEGHLGAAGLDVFENEPNVPMELCGMDNVVLTPHIGNATVESRRALEDLLVANIDAYFSGKPLLTPVLL